ncbi:Hypothetical protein A7982_01250 [Minicystis rosea]|nr:Hypothetical protein A7982_01250 [Minicystis rosea]
MLIPYFTMQDLTSNQFKPPIAQIIVGPTPHKELNVASTRTLLRRFGFPNVSVDCSPTPYRA